MVSSRETRVDFQLSAEFVVERGDELCASIRDNRVRQTVVTLYVADKHARYVASLYLIAGDHVSVLR